MWFKKVCEEYGLSGEYADLEPGAGFFRHIIIEDGEVVRGVVADYLSQESVEFYGGEYFLGEYVEFFDRDDEEDLESARKIAQVLSSFGKMCPEEVLDAITYSASELG